MERLSENQVRLQKRDALQKQGIPPYPARPNIDRTQEHTKIAYVRAEEKTLLAKESRVDVAGRIREKRVHGGSLFAVIEDESGSIQTYIQRDALGNKDYTVWKELIDIGDFIEVSGVVFKTKTGELTVRGEKWQLLTKSVLPLPEQWHGLSDVEVRYRKRYLDLLANPNVREIARKRSRIVRAIREFLDERGFLEVETPILQTTPSGAFAKPFVTHHNALDTDFYLRVAPELYLKRLMVGGFERVYEIARCFRNEGIDHSHNPEFTQVEFYYAYIDYTKLMEFTEEMLRHVVSRVGNLRVPYGKNEIDFTPPYPRMTFRDSILKYAKIDIEDYPDAKSIAGAAIKKGCDVTEEMGRGKIADELFKMFVRPHIIQPTFIIDHPIELSPLSKTKEDNPRYVERFQLLLGPGFELCNAFSELNDPVDQRERFEEQERLRKAGDEETMPMDEDYVEALSYGMPPTAGLGMGIDRLCSLLTNSHNLKEVILFPTLKPKGTSTGSPSTP